MPKFAIVLRPIFQPLAKFATLESMTILPFYLIHRFFFRIWKFVRHWHIGSFFAIFHWTIALMANLDRTIALRITTYNLFEPLYQDRSFIGYALGFIFRSLRILSGGVLYAIIIALVIASYLVWASIPLLIILKIIFSILIVPNS